jgi:hypothetical protein
MLDFSGTGQSPFLGLDPRKTDEEGNRAWPFFLALRTS